MRNIPVDTSRLSFIAAGDAEPKIKDPSSGELKTDAEGRTLYSVPLLPVPNDDRGRSIRVTVAASEPPAVSVGQPVQVVGLTAFGWAMNGRSGIGYRAESITTTTARAGV
ncbi:MAG: hypothetical protein ACRDPK_12555 [Carbonactinosporaceae bacterium]